MKEMCDLVQATGVIPECDGPGSQTRRAGCGVREDIVSYKECVKMRNSLAVKLYVMVIGAVCVGFGILTYANYYSFSQILERDGRDSAMLGVDEAVTALQALNEARQSLVNSDIEVLRATLRGMGLPTLDPGLTSQVRAVNQSTGQAMELNIPTLRVGDKTINSDTGFVDSMQAGFNGGSVTVFQVMEQPRGLLRVSTNVFLKDGGRAVNTFIPEDSPVYSTVMRGEVYKGAARVVGDWYATAYFPLRNIRGEIVAAVYTGRKILSKDMRAVAEKAKVFGRGFVAIYNAEGELVLHTNPDLEGKTLEELGLESRKFITADRKILEYELGGEDKFAAIGLVDEKLGWRIGLGLAKSDLTRDLDSLVLKVGVICCGVLLFLMLAALVPLVHSLLRPIKATQKAAHAIAEGDLDATFEVYASSREVRGLQDAIIRMVSRLREMIADSEKRGQELEVVAQRASESRMLAEQERRRAAEAAVNGRLQAASTIEGVVEGISSASVQLAAQINQARDGSEQQDGLVQETATAMEQMNATIQEMARNAANVAQSSMEARRAALEGAEVVDAAKYSITHVQTISSLMEEGLNDLGRRAEDIGQIMSVISDIADQTNLLALNAAIEAARAGDAGRGFAVVADEVRKLAEKTMQATSQVKSAVGSIQNGTRQSIAKMAQAGSAVRESAEKAGRAVAALERIVSLVEESTEQIHSIASATEQQSAASEQVGRSTQTVSRISGDTRVAMSDAASAVNQLADLSERLRGLTDSLKDRDENRGEVPVLSGLPGFGRGQEHEGMRAGMAG